MGLTVAILGAVGLTAILVVPGLERTWTWARSVATLIAAILAVSSVFPLWSWLKGPMGSKKAVAGLLGPHALTVGQQHAFTVTFRDLRRTEDVWLVEQPEGGRYYPVLRCVQGVPYPTLPEDATSPQTSLMQIGNPTTQPGTLFRIFAAIADTQASSALIEVAAKQGWCARTSQPGVPFLPTGMEPQDPYVFANRTNP
jgi:hypothetical protein